MEAKEIEECGTEEYNTEKIDTDISEKEVVSYIDVFENYYTTVTDYIEDSTIICPLSFDEFYEGYYSHDYDIETYTNCVIEYIEENSDSSCYYGKTLYSSGSSPDADYILNSTYDYEYTPVNTFKRPPVYNGYEGQTFDYSNLLIGDIIYETITFLNVGHTAIVTDLNHGSPYGSYIQTVEAVGSGVNFGILDDDRMVRYGVIILRVPNITNADREEIVSFVKGQIGKPYSLDFGRLNQSYDSTKWYCSELCYAAYKHIGVDISIMQGSAGNVSYRIYSCMPDDIYNSYNTYDKCMIDSNYVDIQLVYGAQWQIKIYNNTGEDRPVYYNEKMCFEEDAKQWNGLNNVNSIYVPSGDSKTVTIKSNWFATDIAISVVDDSGHRYITYAHNLNAGDYYYTMSIFYNK